MVLEVMEFALDPASMWQGPLQHVLQAAGEWAGYCMYSRPGTLVQEGQSAVLAGKSCFLHPVFWFYLLAFKVRVVSITALGRKRRYF